MKRFNGPGNLDGRFVERNPNTGQPGSRPDASWLNSIQEELCSVVTDDGVAINPNKRDQLHTQVHARKKSIASMHNIPLPDVFLPLTGDLRMQLGYSTAIEVSDNAGTPVNTPIIGASYTRNTPAYEVDKYINAIYPNNVARYSEKGIKLSRATSNFCTQSWDIVNYVRGANPNLREASNRTMFGRAGTRITKTATDYLYILGVYGRKIVNADKEHTYTICYNLDFAAENKIRYMRSRLAYIGNWAQTGQIEVDLLEGRVINSKAIRYEEVKIDNFLIVSATGKSSLSPETTGGGSIDIIPLREPLQATEDPTVVGVAEIMWTQLQEDSSWAGYVETNGQEATRVTDLLTVDGKNFAVNSDDGITFKCKFTPMTIDTSIAQYLFDIGTSSANRLGVYIHRSMIFITNGTSGKSIDINNILRLNNENTLIVSIKNGETVKFVLNGTFIEIPGIFNTMPVDTKTTLKIGSSWSGNYKTSIYIRDWTWWNSAFTVNQLLGACK